MILQVPEPCSASWNDMDPGNGGRHCASCNKMVVDFTAMKDEEVLNYFRDKADHVCGRFQAGQLDRSLAAADSVRQPAMEPVRHRAIFRNWLLALGWQWVFAFSFGCEPTMGKVRQPFQPEKVMDSLPNASNKIIASRKEVTMGTPRQIIGDTILGNDVSKEQNKERYPFDTAASIIPKPAGNPVGPVTEVLEGKMGGMDIRDENNDTAAPRTIRMGAVATILRTDIYSDNLILTVVDKAGRPVGGASIRPESDTSKDGKPIWITDSLGTVHIHVPDSTPKRTYIIRSAGFKDGFVRFSGKNKRTKDKTVVLDQEDVIVVGMLAVNRDE